MADLAHAPVALTLSFLDAINRGDLTRLADLMADDYRLTVFDEAPRTGRENGVADWRGYLASFPDYIIHPHKIVGRDQSVAVLGATSGSHLGLPDAEEMKLTLIWLCQLAGGKVQDWKLIPDTPENRRRFGLDT